MKETISVIVKSPDEKVGHLETIRNELEDLQKIVGGYIETVPAYDGALLVCNEEGAIRGFDPNFASPYGIIRGTVFVCGTDGEDFDDCPMDLKMWEDLLGAWGN